MMSVLSAARFLPNFKKKFVFVLVRFELFCCASREQVTGSRELDLFSCVGGVNASSFET